MLNMSHINHIRAREMQGYQLSEIEAETHHDHNTIQNIWNGGLFAYSDIIIIKPSILDYKPTILKWLDEGKRQTKSV